MHHGFEVEGSVVSSIYTSDWSTRSDVEFEPNQTLEFTCSDVYDEARDCVGVDVDEWTDFVIPGSQIELFKRRRWVQDQIQQKKITSAESLWIALAASRYRLHLGSNDDGHPIYAVYDWSTTELLGISPFEHLKFGFCWQQKCNSSAFGSNFLMCSSHTRQQIRLLRPVHRTRTDMALTVPLYDEPDFRQLSSPPNGRQIRRLYYTMLEKLAMAWNGNRDVDFSMTRPQTVGTIQHFKRTLTGQRMMYRNIHLLFDGLLDCFVLRHSFDRAVWTEICDVYFDCGRPAMKYLNYCPTHAPITNWRFTVYKCILGLGKVAAWNQITPVVAEDIFRRLRFIGNEGLEIGPGIFLRLSTQGDICIKINKTSLIERYKLCSNFDKGCDRIMREDITTCTQCKVSYTFDVLLARDTISGCYVTSVFKRATSKSPNSTKWVSHIINSLHTGPLILNKRKLETGIESRERAYGIQCAIIVYTLIQADVFAIPVEFINVMPDITKNTFTELKRMLDEDEVSIETGNIFNIHDELEILLRFPIPLQPTDTRSSTYLISHRGHSYVGSYRPHPLRGRGTNIVSPVHDKSDSTNARHVYALARPLLPELSTLGILGVCTSSISHDIKTVSHAMETIFILAFAYAEQVIANQNIILYNARLSSTSLPRGWTNWFWRIIGRQFQHRRHLVWNGAQIPSLLW